MRAREDRAKEKETMEKIETEQRAAGPQAGVGAGKRAQCVKALGPELFDKVYQCIKRAMISKTDFQQMQKDLLTLVNNDKEKMNVVFLVDQMVELEVGDKSSI